MLLDASNVLRKALAVERVHFLSDTIDRQVDRHVYWMAERTNHELQDLGIP